MRSQHVRAHKALAEFYEKKGQTDKAAEHRRYVRSSEDPSSTSPPHP